MGDGMGSTNMGLPIKLLETYNDDGEKFGGERILRALRDGQAIDVLTVCCRWYGGEMIGVSQSHPKVRRLEGSKESPLPLFLAPGLRNQEVGRDKGLR